MSDISPATISAEESASGSQFNPIVTIAVHELGPVVQLLSSAALIEGSTEVVLHISVFTSRPVGLSREFTVQWRSGGPGVVKGVAGLPDDLNAALQVALQPGNRGPDSR